MVVRCRELHDELAATGTLISNGGGHASGKLGRVIRSMLASMVVRQQAKPTVKTTNRDDMSALVALVEAGKVTPVIDRTYPLAETAAAIRHVGTGHARGTVVIAVTAPTSSTPIQASSGAPVGPMTAPGLA